MKKIYMRGGMASFETFNPLEVQYQNIIGNNVGNLLYQYGVLRTLMVKDVSVEVNRYTYNLDEIERINEECSCFIIPLADAFRETFVKELNKITKLVKQLTIPCVVIGVGLRADYEPNFSEGFPFDEDVIEFVKAVLEKSSMIGVRGELTAQYLANLGFREEVDYTVIGCPSLYTFGQTLTINNKQIGRESNVAINASNMTPREINSFIFKNGKLFNEYTFIPQLRQELMLLYAGKNYDDIVDGDYPSYINESLYREGHVKFFLNAPTWFEYLKNIDFTFGSRLHGNIAASLSGTPSMLIPIDARTRELVAYHNLTSVPYTEIKADTNIFDLVENLDFQSPTSVQSRNFEHFIDFLNKNNLEHIYTENMNRTDAPLDQIMNNIIHEQAVDPITICQMDEISDRLVSFNSHEIEKYNKLSADLKGLRDKSKVDKELIKTLKKENADLQKVNTQLSQNMTNRVSRNIKKIIGLK